ncbi:MAG TPA: hypothetical protein VGC91_14330 [Pyrinomonadaceae bacterium]|jgi:phenylacetate-coenzyme A ligase PaaK-like adenylate-forming protein
MASIRDFRVEIEQIVSCVRSRFRWYDEQVAACGYDRNHDPESLFYVDESLLNEHYYGVNYPELSQCQSYLTSGTSSGARKRILYSDADHDRYVQQRTKIFSGFITSDCRVACADLGTGHAASSAAEIFQNLGLENFHIDFRKPVQEHIELLEAYRPDVLFTMPMILESIIHAGPASFRPRKIIVVGDVASRAWKNHIIEYFGLGKNDLMDIVGSIEVGSIAYECFDCGLYHLDDHIIAEAIKPAALYEDGIEAGAAEILILTSTARTVFPAIRFVTNDLIEGFTTISCKGRSVFAFEKMIGRIGQELKNGEKVSLYDISEAVNTYLPGSRFEVYKDAQRFVIRVCSAEFTKHKAEQIKGFVKKLNPDVSQMIQSALVADIEVCNVPVNELAHDAAKKSFLIKNKG